MPRPRPPYLNREETRHGKVVWFVRVGKGPRTRLRSPYGAPEFWQEYRAALDDKPITAAPAKTAAGSLLWLYERYRDSPAWRALSSATRRQRENIFVGVMAKSGAEKFAAVNRASIVAARDARATTPAQARNLLDAMRGMFRWALEAGHVRLDPTAGVKNPPRPKTKGFPAWTEADVDAYQARWPLGTRQRDWLDVLLYTGLRRGDAVLLGRQNLRDGIATLGTEKSDGEIVVTLPILPVLAKTPAAGPCGDLAFICGARGQPLTKETFGNEFTQACRAAGIIKSAHGVRKIGATRAAENGATVAQLEAIFGWRGGRMASLYTRTADRARLSREAINMLTRTDGAQITPAPMQKVRARKRKSK